MITLSVGIACFIGGVFARPYLGKLKEKIKQKLSSLLSKF
jgi:hypothetical protein